jgi:hypothetical protein
MSSTPRSTGGRPTAWLRRRLVWPALMAAFAAVLVSATPGIASASTGTVTPLLDCYAQNSDGSYTVILGYTNTNPGTTNIPIGTNNYTYPTSYQSQMPTRFTSGTHHAVVTVRVSQADVYNNARWYLDGHTLNYLQAAYASGICTPQQLPALGNGTGLVVALLIGGVAGVVIIRRLVRRGGDRTPAGTGRA